jgi:hypothetical protein
VPFPEGLHDKKDQLLRPDVLQPKVAYDARELEAGPGSAIELEGHHRLPSAEHPLHLRQIELTSRNVHGLRSKSEELYPQAYFPVDTAFWAGLSDQQQAEVMRLQAVAQEKVGYERGSPKYFMQDFDTRAVDKKTSGQRLVEIETPRLLLAGAMLGVAVTLTAGFALGVVAGSGVAVVAVMLVLAGVLTMAFGKN